MMAFLFVGFFLLFNGFIIQQGEFPAPTESHAGNTPVRNGVCSDQLLVRIVAPKQTSAIAAKLAWTQVPCSVDA